MQAVGEEQHEVTGREEEEEKKERKINKLDKF